MLKNWAPPSAVLLLALFVLATGNSPGIHGRANGGAGARTVGAVQPTAASFSHLPIVFEPNRGQTDPRVKFLARGGGYTLFLTSDEAVFVAQSANKRSVLRVRLLGGNRKAEVHGLEQLPGRSNYLMGSDPANWRTDIPTYSRVEYREVYPGVDLAFYSRHGKLEYDWVVKPGGDPAAIRVAFEGAEDIRIDGEGDLVVTTGGGEFRNRRAAVCQEWHGTRYAVDGAYTLSANGEVGFRVADHDPGMNLVIDPSLVYSAIFGGTVVYSRWGWRPSLASSVALDSAGNVYVHGTATSPDFPTKDGVQPKYPGDCNVLAGCTGARFVVKVNPEGNAVIYSTFLGVGGGAETIAVDGSGNVYLAGSFLVRKSFPAPTEEACEGTPWVAKLSPSGSALLYATCLPAAGSLSAIVVDPLGQAYVAGTTSLDKPFPTTPGAFRSTGGSYDAFVLKLSADGSSVVFSALVGGTQGETASGIALDSAGNIYVTGNTRSADFPTVPGAGFVPTGPFTFVFKLSSDGSRLAASTLLRVGGEGTYIAVDAAGSVFLTGGTGRSGMQISGGAQSAYGGGEFDAFVARLSPDLATMVSFTYLGGKWTDYGAGLALDAAGNVHVAGWTTSPDFPLVRPLQAALSGGGCWSGEAADPDCADAFIAKLNPNLSSFIYSTYFGGALADRAAGIATDAAGNAVVVGVWGDMGAANASAFPEAGPLQLLKTGRGAFLVKITEAGSLPLFSAASVTNGASFAPGLSNGAITTIFGTSLTSITGVVTASGFPLPTELGGTSVLVGGVPAPLFAVANVNGQEQINFQAPPPGSLLLGGVTVVNRGVRSIPAGMLRFPVGMGVFTTDGTHAAAQHGGDFRPITLSDPAQKGEVVVIYATGLGEMKPEPGWGKPASASPLSLTVAKTSATINGIPAEVLFSGLAPGFVGLGQINLRIPQNVPSGDLELVIQVDTAVPVSSNKVKLPVR